MGAFRPHRYSDASWNRSQPPLYVCWSPSYTIDASTRRISSPRLMGQAVIITAYSPCLFNTLGAIATGLATAISCGGDQSTKIERVLGHRIGAASPGGYAHPRRGVEAFAYGRLSTRPYLVVS
jgi:hypothetical protein